jgi:hypothetical protein
MPNIDEAIEALLSYQQADMEGVMVLTSRQAIHEVADELKRLRGAAQATTGPREALDALADKVCAKIAQLEHYKANDCQLDHARTIAEGRISQANQILHWIAESAINYAPSLSSTNRCTCEAKTDDYGAPTIKVCPACEARMVSRPHGNTPT